MTSVRTAPNVVPYTNAVDAWAMAVLTYELVVGRPPFNGGNKEATVRLIVDGRYNVPPSVSQCCANLIETGLEQGAERRASIDSFLQHPWVTRRAGQPCMEPDAAATKRTIGAGLSPVRPAFAAKKREGSNGSDSVSHASDDYCADSPKSTLSSISLRTIQCDLKSGGDKAGGTRSPTSVPSSPNKSSPRRTRSLRTALFGTRQPLAQTTTYDREALASPKATSASVPGCGICTSQPRTLSPR